MKKLFFAILSFVFVLALIFCTSAKSFKDYNASLTLPDEYIEINADNAGQYEDGLKLLGHTKQSFIKHLNNNNVLLFAVLPDNSRQVQFKWDKTVFSQQIVDISLAENESLDKIGEKIISDASFDSRNTVDYDGVKYFEAVYSSKDGNGCACVQYITIRNGYLFTLAVYGDKPEADESFEQEALKILKCLKINKAAQAVTAQDADRIIVIVLTLAFIVLAIVAAVLICISFFKDYKEHKQSGGEGKDKTIKRRKY